jgi:hypothetical protein
VCAFALASAGCSLVLGGEYSAPRRAPDAAAGADPASQVDVPDDAGAPLFDATVPADAFFDDDANVDVPDAAEVGCVAPTSCGASQPCCAPGQCNATNHCVAVCLQSGGTCGNEGACCLGLHCDETYRCQQTCGGDNDRCGNSDRCCLGYSCRGFNGRYNCQRCNPSGNGCRYDYDCCSFHCNFGRCG